MESETPLSGRCSTGKQYRPSFYSVTAGNLATDKRDCTTSDSGGTDGGTEKKMQ